MNLVKYIFYSSVFFVTMLTKELFFSNCKLNYVKDLYSALIEQGTSLVALMVKNLPAMQETQVRSLSQEDILEKGMATPLQYSCLNTKKPGGL